MNRPKLIAILLLILLAGIVVFQNREDVETKVLFFTITASRAVLLSATLAVGVVAGFLMGWRSARSE